MDLKLGILAIAAVAVWLCCIMAQVVLIFAFGITAILWMAFAASCALGTVNEDETVIVGFVPERDIL
jgi:hypothetical protein